MKRRTLLQMLVAGLVALPARVGLRAQPGPLRPADLPRLHALGDIVLPHELDGAQRARVLERFAAWVQNYRADAETDHGYGFPRLRRTPASPFGGYPAQLAALGPAFESLPVPDRTRAVEAAIAAAKVQRLPGRPDGGHIATDLMAFYFNSVEANDLCYRAQIGRDTCRGLAGSENRPAPLGGTSTPPIAAVAGADR
jgi:hypothetical protein